MEIIKIARQRRSCQPEGAQQRDSQIGVAGLPIVKVPIWQLCFQGKLPEVRVALAREEDINSKDEFNTTGLMWAVMNNYNSIVRLLLEQPAVDLNCTDNNGRTAMHHAAVSDNVEGLRMLLASDHCLTTVNHEDDLSCTPVMLAMKFENMKALRELVAHPSVDLDINCLNVMGSDSDRWFDTRSSAQQKFADQAERIVCNERQRREKPTEKQQQGNVQVEQEVEELRRKQEKLVEEAIKRSEEMVKAAMEESEERLEEVKLESRIVEEMVEQEQREKERKLKEENEKALARLVNKNRERDEKMKRENVEANQQLRRQNEESLALLLSENEAEMAALKVQLKQNKEKNERSTTRKRKLEAATKNQPSAPECPVWALEYLLV